MKKILNRDNAYSFTDSELMKEICRRVKAVRLSSCLSQEEWAKTSGVSRSTIRRIESGNVDDIGLKTLMKLMRTGGMMDGFGNLIEEVPIHPDVRIKKGVRLYVSSNNKHLS